MEYESPIDIIYRETVSDFEDKVLRSIHSVGIGISKDDLVKALQQDRERYQKAYEKGYKDADSKIVRCKHCVYWQDNNNGYPHPECRWNHEETPDPDDYCSFAEDIRQVVTDDEDD